MEVILRPVARKTWAGVTRFKNCSDYLGTYITRSGQLYTGLEKEDELQKVPYGTNAERLEKLLGFQEGTLSNREYKASDNTATYWDIFTIKIMGTKEIVLDLTKPLDELQYIFLKNHKRVADGFANINPSKDYVLVNKDAEANEINKINKRRRDAMVAFNKLSLEDMRKCLRIYGYNASNMSNEVVEAKLFELVEQDPDKFVTKWINNTKKLVEFMVEEAVSKNIIRRNKNVYKYGTEVIGISMEDTVKYLEDPKNQDLRMAIVSELEVK